MHYPKPIHDVIIEPFAGAAQYSLFGSNWEKNVILIDKYQVIVDIWNYLITASENDISQLPALKENDSLDDFKLLCQAEKYLIGFCINSGSSMPKKTPQKYNSWDRYKKYIAQNVYKIKHWRVYCKNYDEIDNISATWFIDPPYQFGGQYYRYGNADIDYSLLPDWCKSRIGQIIVCENMKANWLDFQPLTTMNGQLHRTTEAIWTNHQFYNNDYF